MLIYITSSSDTYFVTLPSLFPNITVIFSVFLCQTFYFIFFAQLKNLPQMIYVSKEKELEVGQAVLWIA